MASIRRWWQARGRLDYPHATRLLITADAGGSNSYRLRLWKAELAQLAAETGLTITVCHFPPGTSKWNKIEHRLFSHITMNWRGRPLTSHEVVVNTIAATQTHTGLRVEAELDTNAYPTGVSISTQRMRALPIQPHQHRGVWNYTISSSEHDGRHAPTADRAQLRASALQTLTHPTFTGMTRHELDALTSTLAPLQAAQDKQRQNQQRGRRRVTAPATPAGALLSNADRLLIAIVYLRQICSQRALSEMLEIHLAAIGQAIAQTRQLLDQQGLLITASTLHFTDLHTMKEYLAGNTAMNVPPDLPWVLADPHLTGMSRDALAALVKQVTVTHHAHVARLRHQRRGRDRLPGTRNSAFRQKITDAERILATVLYQRGVCARHVLADLFHVSTRTIGAILAEVRPVLDHHGWTPAPGAPHYASAEALLASAAPNDTPS